MIGYKEGLKLVGRVILKEGINYTVTSVNHPYGAIAVWNPQTSDLIFFDSIETFENWAYGAPVSTRVEGER